MSEGFNSPTVEEGGSAKTSNGERMEVLRVYIPFGGDPVLH